MKKQALILDMDGVIIDSEGEHLNALHEYVKSFNPEVEKEDMYELVGRSKQDVWMRIKKITGSSKEWYDLCQDYRERWLKSHNYNVDYVKIFRPEIKEILEYARRKKMKTAVASSTKYEIVLQVMKTVGIIELLDVIVSGDFVQQSKPDPEIYKYTCQKLEVEPEQCITVEDSTVGILAARSAKIEVIALIDKRYNFDQSLADHRIENLMEIKKFL